MGNWKSHLHSETEHQESSILRASWEDVDGEWGVNHVLHPCSLYHTHTHDWSDTLDTVDMFSGEYSLRSTWKTIRDLKYQSGPEWENRAFRMSYVTFLFANVCVVCMYVYVCLHVCLTCVLIHMYIHTHISRG